MLLSSLFSRSKAPASQAGGRIVQIAQAELAPREERKEISWGFFAMRSMKKI